MHQVRFSPLPPSLANRLAKSDAALLLIMDEAHEADPAALGDLLNRVQIVGGHRPVALVLAGTPGLPIALDASGAGFWHRGEILLIGLLSDDEAHAVLARQFRDAGLDVEDGGAAAMASAAANYPFFSSCMARLSGKAARRLPRRHDGPRDRSEKVTLWG